MSDRPIGRVTDEIGPVEVRERYERETIDDADPRPGQLNETVLAQATQHAVDVWDAEAQDICEFRLGQRQVERRAVAHADRAEAGRELEQEVSQPLVSIAPADVRKMLAEHSGLAGRGPEYR